MYKALNELRTNASGKALIDLLNKKIEKARDELEVGDDNILRGKIQGYREILNMINKSKDIDRIIGDTPSSEGTPKAQGYTH